MGKGKREIKQREKESKKKLVLKKNKESLEGKRVIKKRIQRISLMLATRTPRIIQK